MGSFFGAIIAHLLGVFAFFLAICVQQIAARDQPSSGHERERKAKGLARARIHIGPPEEAENPYCLILVLSFLLLLLAIL